MTKRTAALSVLRERVKRAATDPECILDAKAGKAADALRAAVSESDPADLQTV